MRGTPLSSGVARGTACVLASTAGLAAPRRRIAVASVEAEEARFDRALERAAQELIALRQEVTQRIGAAEAEIFAAQALMLADIAFRSQVLGLVRSRLINAEAALSDVVDTFSQAFDEIGDPVLRERSADVRDVGRRVLWALIGDKNAEVLQVPDGAVVIAQELSPSVTARLDLGRVRAFVTAHGGKFSHTAILARSQGIPAVSGIADAPVAIKTGDSVVVDAFTGVVFIHPSASVVWEYQRLEGEIRADREKLKRLVPLPSITLDNVTVGLFANINKYADTEAALLYNADGIGLYRTEFGYAIRSRFPTEEEQYELHLKAAQRFFPRKVVFRLLDIGGDKELPYFLQSTTRNPSLARRGIRLLLEHPEILRCQLRAFLRVSAAHPVRILLPVVSGLDEVRRTRAILSEVQDELRAEGVGFDEHLPLGAMIEIPSAAILLSQLAREVEFFSLGTNDLVQYLLAADRENESVSEYYQPAHPAVLSLIRTVVESAAASGRELSICGDVAGDPFYTELLLGLGLREFSVPPGEILDVKHRIRNISIQEARILADQALQLPSAHEVASLLEDRWTRWKSLTPER